MIRGFLSRVTGPVFLRSAGCRRFSDMTEGANTPEQQPQDLRMEKSVNQVNLIGRLGRDAELRGSTTYPVVVFTMATNLIYTKQDGEKIYHTDWHRISVFKPGLREQVAAHLRKGDRVYVTGSIRYDEYKDNNDVQQRSVTIIASDILNLTKKYLQEEG